MKLFDENACVCTTPGREAPNADGVNLPYFYHGNEASKYEWVMKTAGDSNQSSSIQSDIGYQPD
jgi:hypothetical protein